MKLRAFLIEDDEDIRLLVSRFLKRRRYEVLSYSEPLFCPVYLDRECPCPYNYACGDIFISDLKMPRMTGLELIENQIRRGCKVSVLNMALMSGTWGEPDLGQARRIGCQVFDKVQIWDKLGGWLDECEKRIDPNRKLMDLKLFEGKSKDR